MREQLNQWGKEGIPFVFLIDFECQKPLCWRMDERIDTFNFNFQGITNQTFNKTQYPQAKVGEKENTGIEAQSGLKVKFELTKQPVGFELYKAKFELVKKEIEYGNSFLVNLTIPTAITTNYNLESIFKNAKAKYTCWLKDEFVCFSPETFVRIQEGKIYAYPMKGTIDASIPNAKEILINDNKEVAEHATIVDLIRNDLSSVANNVKVKRFRFYEELKTQNGTLGQISSEIEGTLAENFKDTIGDLIFKLLPAGSVSGAPKTKTLEIIAQAEREKRGYYTGVTGYFDGQNLDSCVLIRYLQADDIYRSGGGITFQSDAKNEYQEILDKVYVPIF
jgi:para-aminobenzoate synthetase component 1